MSKIVIITLILAVLFLFSTYIIDFFYKLYLYTFEFGWLRGEKTKEKIAAKYVEGLKTENSQIIEKLIPKTHEATKEIQDKIEIFKESDFSEVEISFEPDGHLTRVKIKNIRLKNGEIISEEIWIQGDCQEFPGMKCKKWYLVMGTAKEKFQPDLPVIKLEGIREE